RVPARGARADRRLDRARRARAGSAARDARCGRRRRLLRRRVCARAQAAALREGGRVSGMRLYRSLAALERRVDDAPRAVAIGVFDGLHLGHQEILRRARALAARDGCRTAVCSFEPMPEEFFAPHAPPARLTRFRERFERLEGLGVDELFCPRFAAVRALEPEAFIERLLVAGLHARHVLVGDDFRFGAERRGTVEALAAAGARHGFDVTEVQPVLADGERISSTAIRAALARGDLETARAMLGRDYSMSGRVVRGLGLGKKLGF